MRNHRVICIDVTQVLHRMFNESDCFCSNFRSTSCENLSLHPTLVVDPAFNSEVAILCLFSDAVDLLRVVPTPICLVQTDLETPFPMLVMVI
jgi:hypothetical protein